MSAPPLPDIFGNYVLGDFAEVVSPQAISWLPQTEGWLWLGGLLLILLTRYLWKRLRQWYRERYRREAAARLQQLADSAQAETILAELNQLLKLTAMAAFGRERVARLSGADWIDFLNNQCPTPSFSQEQGHLLSLAVYNSTGASGKPLQELFVSCRRWVRDHERPEDV